MTRVEQPHLSVELCWWLTKVEQQPLSRPLALARRRRVASGQPLLGLLVGHTRGHEGDGMLAAGARSTMNSGVIGLILESVNRTEWQIGPWQPSIQLAVAI